MEFYAYRQWIHFHWRPYKMLEKKKTGERVPNSGVGALREKGVKIAQNREKGYPNRYDQSSSHAIKPERVGNLRQHVHYFFIYFKWTSKNKWIKASNLF